MRTFPLRVLMMIIAAILTAGLASAPTSTALTPVSAGVSTTGEPAASTAATSEREQAARAGTEPLSKWKCGAWRSHGGIGWRYCARLYDITDKIKIDYRERFYNDSNEAEKATCSHATTTTWTFGASVSGEVEAGVIFSKVKVSATASVSRAASTTKTTSITKTVRPKSYAYCERGMHGFTYSGLIRRQTCDRATPGAGCRYDDMRSFKGSAPSAGFWRIGDGRGGVEINP